MEDAEDPVSLLLGDVHPKAQTALGILVLAESRGNWISNKNLASLLVVTQSIKQRDSLLHLFPLQVFPCFLFSVGTLAVVPVHGMLGCG